MEFDDEFELGYRIFSSRLYFPLLSVLTAAVILLILAIRYDKRQQNKKWKAKDKSREGLEFESLPNFRQAGGLPAGDGKRVKDGVLYRSSRTDFLTEPEVTRFCKLGIKSIIDLRRVSEYRAADGAKLLDSKYPISVVKAGKVKEFKMKGASSMADKEVLGRRLLVNMVSMDLIWHVVLQVNFLVRYLSLVLLPFDHFFKVHLFVRFYNWLVVNRQEMYVQYVDLLEYSKPAVKDIMEQLLEGAPALIHCAHGKDRTGVIIAVILGCLGVSDEDIALDYGKSWDGLACMRNRLYSETVGRYGFRMEFAGAEAKTMKQVLEEINSRYGNVSGYLESAGFGSEKQMRLRNILLEPEQ